MCIDGHRQMVSNTTAQPGSLLRPVDIRAWVLQDLFDAQGVGVPVEHALRTQAVARQTDTVLGTRPVERIVTILIEEGFLARGFSVRGESSDQGPQAGFIRVDQRLSRWENHDTAEVYKLNLTMAKGMDGGAYTRTDLRIFQQRPMELVRNFGLVADGVGPIRLLTAWGPSGKHYEFEARQEPDGLYRINRLGWSEVVQVLADPTCGLTMTASCDFFLIALSIEAHGNGGLDARGSTAVRYIPLGAKDPLSKDGFYDRKDMAKENITSRTRQLVDALSDYLGRGEHREMFHHSDNVDNPGSHVDDNFPATFYPPRATEHRLGEELVRSDEVCAVTDRKSFSLLVGCIRGNGYHFTAHPDWSVPLQPSSQEALSFSNVRPDARRSLAKPAFPSGMGTPPSVQGLPPAGICWTVRGSQE